MPRRRLLRYVMGGFVQCWHLAAVRFGDVELHVPFPAHTVVERPPQPTPVRGHSDSAPDVKTGCLPFAVASLAPDGENITEAVTVTAL
ncbi:hypothetical protein T440DRAFT_471535 [Plenodomus tracheiphilus IPT5]|uniref:Uncharacterized protein n=1 Tax=Plenodomus tracheiphilus IPT5 TaxID=1408161 RepID=A0A6A7AU70_9PLEO|nr:hypothetical protein T440DRAFT_471535 [Plenodomus tracheiphilus IPT5]